MRLRPDERILLDLLCLAAPMTAELDRAFRLRASWGQPIDVLRMKGLVAMDNLAPSPSALADYAERHATPAPEPTAVQARPNPTVGCRGPVRRGAAFWGSEPPARASVWDDPDRKARFIEALRRLGAIGPAAVEIGRPWASHGAVGQARRRDSEFDRDCRQAIESFAANRPLVRAIAAFAVAAGRLRPVRAVPKAARGGGRARRASFALDTESQPSPASIPNGRLAHGLGLRSPAKRSRFDHGFGDSFHGEGQPTEPKRWKSDAEISAETLRYLEERKRVEALAGEGPSLSIDEAKLRLQRRGRSVYRMSVHGGADDRWYVSGLGKDVTDEQLVAAARAVPA